MCFPKLILDRGLRQSKTQSHSSVEVYVVLSNSYDVGLLDSVMSKEEPVVSVEKEEIPKSKSVLGTDDCRKFRRGLIKGV